MDSDNQIDMIWEKYWLGRPAGTHYSEGTSSALLFGDGGRGLETHAKRGSRVEDDEESEEEPDLLKWAVAIGAGVLIGVGVVKAVPHVRNWRRNLHARWTKDTAHSQVVSSSETTALSAIPVEDFTHAVDDALAERNTMSTADAERRIVEILLAAAIIAKNMRELSGATIEDGSAELRQAMEKLTLPNITDRLNRMLESDSSALDAETSAVFAQIFGGGRLVEGEFVPVRNDRIKDVLRLPGHDQ